MIKRLTIDKLLSSLLIIATIFATCLFQPMKAVADETHEIHRIEALNSIWSSNNQELLPNASVVGENVARRESNTKHFFRDDSFSLAAVYPYSVHYMKNGAWADIDNRLSLVTLADGNQVYKNAANSYSIAFATSASDSELVRIEKENVSISWSMENASSNSAASIAQTVDNNSDLTILPNLVSSISYANAIENTTVEYRVLPDSVREFITLNSRPTKAPSFSLSLKCEGVSPTTDESGMVVFKDSANKPVFAVSAPYMTDASGETCSEIAISIIAKEGSANEYIYSITPSAEWLNASSRSYPVTIDPDVITNLNAASILDTYVDEEYEDSNFYLVPQLKVGTLNSYEHISYIKFAELPVLQSGDVVVKADFNLTRAQNPGVSTSREIDLYAVASNWESNTITWANQPTLSSKIESISFTCEPMNEMSWDITGLVKRWYAGYNNFGLALKAGVSNNKFAEFYASEMGNTAIRPVAAISYANATGIEATWSYHQQAIGRAGTGYVNDYNGNLVLVHDDAATNGNIMPASVSHVFNGDTKDIAGVYGKGWTINYAQNIKHVTLSGAEYYVHTDEDGTRHYYKQNPDDASKYINQDDSSLELTVSSNRLVIEDSAHNKTVFDSSGKLIGMSDRNDNELTVSYNANSNISSITDGSGNTLTFSYSSGKLYSISNANGLVARYTYNSKGNLTKITYSDGKYSSYAYDSNGNLISVGNHDGYGIDYSYSSVSPYRITGVAEHGGATQGCGLSVEYGWNATSFTDGQGRTNIYQFDNAGQIISIRDIDGSAQYAAYDNHEGRKTYLSAISKLQIPSLNMLANSSFESAGSWYNSNGTLITSASLASEAYLGTHGLKLNANSSYYQSVELEPGKTYTVSGYFKGSSGAIFNAAYYGTKNVSVESVVLNANRLMLPLGESTELTATILPENATNTNTEWLTSNASVVAVDSDGTLNAVSVGSAIITVVADGHSASCTVEVYEPQVAVTGITLNQSSVAMQTNSEAQLVANVLPSNATNKEVVWSSSSSFIVSVDENGKLTSHGIKGKATITATTVDGGFTACCTVTVGSESSMSLSPVKIAYHDFEGLSIPACNEWQRYSFTFTVPQNVQSNTVRIKISMPNDAEGSVYADCLMLDEANGTDRYNLVENADFTNGITNWSTSGSAQISGFTTSDELHPESFSTGVVKIIGNPAGEAKISQTINVSGVKNDRFTFGGWMRADSIPMFTEGETEYGTRKITVEFCIGNTIVNSCDVYFSADCSIWQYTCSAAIAEGTFTSIRITADYSHNCNTAYFDGLQLYKDAFCEYYRYNDDNELSESEDADGDATQYEYDDNGNLTSVTDEDGKVTTYTYDDHGNMLTMTAPDGLSYAYTYDEFGNQLTARTIDSANTSNYMQTSSFYSSNGAFMNASADSRGNVTHYGYDQTTGNLNSVTDGNGNVTCYTYDSMNRPTSMSSVAGTSTAQVGYGYTGDNLTSISHNGFNYGLSYDAFGNVTGVNVNGDVIASYSYDYTRGVIAQTSYGNGFAEHYIYDDMDRVSAIKHGSVTVYRYSYDGEGNLSSVENCLTGVTTSYYYNSDGTLMRTAATDGTVCQYEYLDGVLSKVHQTANGSTWTTEYAYNEDGDPEKVTLNSGTTITDTQSVFGLRTGRTYKNAANNVILNVSMTYLENANGSKSEYLGSYRNGSDAAYVYSYDNNGNITSIVHGSDRITYVYDGLNQLVRVNDSAANTTTTYTYDLGGNILSKSEYDYTTGTLPSKARNTYTYSYDSEWKDLLVSYNGEDITYDEIGNPLAYRGYGMTWNGRQLHNMHKAEQDLTFAYDENGMRVGKSVITIVGGNKGRLDETTYTYAGSQLMSEIRRNTNGTTSAALLYSYDADSTLVSVNYNGTEYYYLRNGQNDVVGLVDGSGDTVVEYRYDAWGKLLSTTGSLASTLGEDNPIRYRGYYYDNETGLYYLQSRYYDPDTGRFINADDVAFLGATGTALSCNLFAYCENDPVNCSDPMGNWKIPLSALKNILIVVGINPIAAVIIGIGIYKLKSLLTLKFTLFIAKLGAFWGPVVQGILVFIAAVTGIFILGPIAVGIFDAIVQGKKGIKITPKKTWFGMPYGINVGVY